MKRRSKVGAELFKGRRRKTPEPKLRIASKTAPRSNSSPTTETTEVARLTRENAGLLSELRESLQQRTATAEVLSIISRSTFDLAKVLNTVLELGASLSKADKGVILRAAGNASYYAAATYRHTPEFIESQKGILFAPGRAGVVGRVLVEGKSVQITDVFDDPDYAYREFARRGGFRTILGVPLVREGSPIGLFVLHRAAVRPFTNKQIQLVETFAAQAVIAIENTRILNELRQRTDDLSESLEQQTATGEILSSMSGSTADTKPVFDTIVRNLFRLFGTRFATIQVLQDGMIHLAAVVGEPGFERMVEHFPRPLDDKSLSGLAMLSKEPFQFSPVIDNPAIPRLGQETARDYGYNSVIFTPMIRGEKVVGAIGTAHREPKPFSDKQVTLLKSFADQAVIAIENARVLTELRQRTDDLTESLENLRTAQDRLIQTEKLASLGQLTAGIAHEIKNPLNFVNNFSAVSVELIDELREALGGAHLDSKLRAEISEIADTLQGNLDKVVQHGKRADAIVKNMLLHSRQGSGEHRPVDINALVDESLNLAYHGARAEKQGFDITLERSFDAAAGEADLFPQEITRALLNLISNGFYAAMKRKAETNGGDYEPTLVAATKNLGDKVEIRIRDNGTGIPLEAKEKLFNPFFTTKPAGEGTGLGLSISHDIIVKQHGGSIEVDTQPGEFTEFRIVLPRALAFIAGGRA